MITWEQVKDAIPHFKRDQGKLNHPGRALWRAKFWRGRDLTDEEDKLARDYWSKYVQEPYDGSEGY